MSSGKYRAPAIITTPHFQYGQQEIIQLGKNKNIIVIQWLQWGDEWKWKVASAFNLDPDIQWCIWALGWGNAGHNIVINGRKIATHELPGSAGHPTAKCYLGTGRVINISNLSNEIKQIQDCGVNIQKKFYVSGGAMVNLRSVDRMIEWVIENSNGKSATGTTKQGIWPSIANHDLRIGFTINDLLDGDETKIRQKISTLKALYGKHIWSENAILLEIQKEKSVLEKMINEWVMTIDRDGMMISSAAERWEKMLIEWNQSVLLGKYGWAYPYNTSSNPSIAWLMDSLGLGRYISEHLGIGTVKGIPSKVWNGTEYFPTRWTNMWEHHAEFEEYYARHNNEVWATSGRIREIGAYDQVQVNHSMNIGWAYHAILVTKVDALRNLWMAMVDQWYEPNYRYIDSYTLTDGRQVKSGLYSGREIEKLGGEDIRIILSGDIVEKNGHIVSRIVSGFPSGIPIFLWTGESEKDVIRYQ
jgi:adenylosuccinate synthase